MTVTLRSSDRLQNAYTAPQNLVFLKPIQVQEQRAVNVFSERGEFLWQSRDRAVAEIIAKANGFTPVSVH